MPWVESWFETYLLPDGGYNCDDEAYRKAKPSSSFTSSLPIYEALLGIDSKKWQPILIQGLNYLESRAFCKSLSKNCVADPNWLKPGFPIFYEYDVIRGMQLALDTHRKLQTRPNLESFAFAFDASLTALQTKDLRCPSDYTSFNLHPEKGIWKNSVIQGFKLLDFLSQADIQEQFIQKRFYRLCQSIY